MLERSLPLLRSAGIDVVRCGPSECDADGASDYALVRVFSDHAAREELESQFYNSRAWRLGPREAVLDAIESYHTVVLTVGEQAVEALRQPTSASERRSRV
jgi:hypothetical protein